jgi:transketolase C-terminal domain/subunit
LEQRFGRNENVGSSNLVGFQELFPERLINVGIAEQNMVGNPSHFYGFA